MRNTPVQSTGSDEQVAQEGVRLPDTIPRCLKKTAAHDCHTVSKMRRPWCSLLGTPGSLHFWTGSETLFVPIHRLFLVP